MRVSKRKLVKFAILLLLLAVPLPLLSELAFSQTCEAPSSCSNNFRVDQVTFSTGSQEACSNSGGPEFCAQQTVGDLTIGAACTDDPNPAFCAQTGFNTTAEPFLEFVVTGTNIDLGYLDLQSVNTANGVFYVRAWQAGGYSVVTAADPPAHITDGHELEPLATPTASAAGTEQFGMNLVENTDFFGAGSHLGENPVQVPDSTFSFGQAADDYDNAGLFKYAKGDIVAFADRSTSITMFTMSYIFNIDHTTPAGQYVFNHNLVAVGQY